MHLGPKSKEGYVIALANICGVILSWLFDQQMGFDHIQPKPRHLTNDWEIKEKEKKKQRRRKKYVKKRKERECEFWSWYNFSKCASLKKKNNFSKCTKLYWSNK